MIGFLVYELEIWKIEKWNLIFWNHNFDIYLFNERLCNLNIYSYVSISIWSFPLTHFKINKFFSFQILHTEILNTFRSRRQNFQWYYTFCRDRLNVVMISWTSSISISLSMSLQKISLTNMISDCLLHRLTFYIFYLISMSIDLSFINMWAKLGKLFARIHSKMSEISRIFIYKICEFLFKRFKYSISPNNVKIAMWWRMWLSWNHSDHKTYQKNLERNCHRHYFIVVIHSNSWYLSDSILEDVIDLSMNVELFRK